MNQEQVIKAINEADKSEYDWFDAIHEQIENKYVKGYLSAKMEELGNSLSGTDDEYAEEILEIVSNEELWNN